MVGAKIGPNFLVLDYQIDSVHFLGGVWSQSKSQLVANTKIADFLNDPKSCTPSDRTAMCIELD